MAANSGPPGPIFIPDQNFHDSSPQIQMKLVESWAGPGNEVSKTEYLERSQDIAVARAHYVYMNFHAKCRSL